MGGIVLLGGSAGKMCRNPVSAPYGEKRMYAIRTLSNQKVGF